MKLNAVKCNSQFQMRRMTMSEQLIKKWHKGLVSASKQSETGRNVWLLFFELTRNNDYARNFISRNLEYCQLL